MRGDRRREWSGARGIRTGRCPGEWPFGDLGEPAAHLIHGYYATNLADRTLEAHHPWRRKAVGVCQETLIGQSMSTGGGKIAGHAKLGITRHPSAISPSNHRMKQEINVLVA